jgi:hypothetical protein
MIRRIETDKTVRMNFLYLYPGSEGSGIFVPGARPATVFLDEAYAGEDKADLRASLTYGSEPTLKEHLGRERYYGALKQAELTVGNRDSALYFETALSHMFDQEVEIKHILTGVTGFSGETYHDLGYLAAGPALH